MPISDIHPASRHTTLSDTNVQCDRSCLSKRDEFSSSFTEQYLECVSGEDIVVAVWMPLLLLLLARDLHVLVVDLCSESVEHVSMRIGVRV